MDIHCFKKIYRLFKEIKNRTDVKLLERST